MTSINSKLGIKAAGKRSMMKLPSDRQQRCQVTAAQCPTCHQRGAMASKLREGWLRCSWCAATWLPAPDVTT